MPGLPSATSAEHSAVSEPASANEPPTRSPRSSTWLARDRRVETGHAEQTGTANRPTSATKRPDDVGEALRRTARKVPCEPRASASAARRIAQRPPQAAAKATNETVQRDPWSRAS